MNRKTFIILFCFLSTFYSIVGFAANDASTKPEGYRAIIPYDAGFLAAGSDGRIDWISESGIVTKSEKIAGEEFRCLLSFDQKVIVAGSKGSILISFDKGKFSKINSGIDKNIYSLVYFNNKILAGSEQGILLTGDENGTFKINQLTLKGNIVSLSVRSSQCFGVTDKGEIIHSKNGIDWDIFDFNAIYEGFYKPCSFIKILAAEGQIAVIGTQNDGSPVLMFSNQGNVWTERPLNYTDEDGRMSTLLETPNDLFYENFLDQLVLVCNKGKLMTIPSCSHCNKLIEISTKNLEGISGNENTMILVGENYYVKSINSN